MSSRKCIYTGKEADCTDKVIPHDGGDIDHNWANSAPCSRSYKVQKGLEEPTELEMQINKAFKMLELAKMDMYFWEKRLKYLQDILQKDVNEPPKNSKKKKKEVELAYQEKEISDINLDKVLKKKKNKVMW